MAAVIVPALVSAGIGAAVQGFTWALFGKLFVGNLVLGALNGALNKPKKQNFQAEARDRLHVVRSSIEPRRVIYGEAAVSGPLAYAESTGSNKEYLHLVIPLAGHEVEAIGDVYLNDERIGPLDGSGNVTTGRFSGSVRVKKHLGTGAQTADADLVAESAGLWSTDHRLQGVAYLYIRLKYSAEVFPNGIPNIQAVVRGRKLYDPRDAGTRWSDNWALIVRDYLTSDHGLGCDASEVDDTLVAAAANAADEWVTMASHAPTVTADHTTDTLSFAAKEHRIGTGDKVTFATAGTAPAGLANGGTYYAIRTGDTTTQLASSYANSLSRTAVALSDNGSGTHTLSHTAQARYTANGTVNRAERPIDILKALLTAGAGALVWSGGAWKLYAGVYHTPTITLTEDDLRGPISVRAKPARKDLYNAVRGTYVEPWKLWQPTDWPQIENATYATQDGGDVIPRDIELPYTTNNVRAQRIGKIHLEKSRQGISLEMPCKLTAFKVGVWDTVQVSIAHLGWSAKVFRVTGWKMAEDGGIDLSLQEEASASYAWSGGDATVADPAPDTALPSLISIAPPTSLSAASGATHQLVQADGLTLCRLYATWTAAADAQVVYTEIQHKLTTDSVYQSTVFPAAVTSAYIAPVKSGSSYHVRVRSLTAGGVPSAWAGPVTIAASSDASTVSASVDYADVTGTKPPANADNTTSAINTGTTVTSGGITFSAGGNIKGGQTDYNTGTGWFLGYSGGAYKFSIGNPSGNRLTWDGSTLTVSGTLSTDYANITGTKPPSTADNTTSALGSGTTISGGGITFSSGGAIASSGKSYGGSTAGIFLGYSGSAYKFDIGNSTNYIRWDGSSLSVGGSIIATGNIVSDSISKVNSSYAESSTSFANGDTIVSASSHASSSGNPTVVIDFCVMPAANTTQTLKLYRDSTVIATFSFTSLYPGGPFAFTVSDAPGDTSAHTYALKQESGGSRSFTNRSIVVATHKR